MLGLRPSASKSAVIPYQRAKIITASRGWLPMSPRPTARKPAEQAHVTAIVGKIGPDTAAIAGHLATIPTPIRFRSPRRRGGSRRHDSVSLWGQALAVCSRSYGMKAPMMKGLAGKRGPVVRVRPASRIS